MILVCPSCASTHHIARQLLGPKGRQVRCAQCRTLWFQAPAEEVEPQVKAEIAVVAQSTRIDDRPATRIDERPVARIAANENLPALATPRRESVLGRLWGLVAVGGIAASLMAAVAHRETVVRLFPVTQGVFAAIGLPVNLRGLDLRTVKSSLLEDGSQHVIAVTGEIANLRTVAQAVPGVRIALRGADGREVYNWTAPPPKPELAAGETIAFRTRLADPPSGAHDVVVQFAEVAKTEAGGKDGH